MKLIREYIDVIRFRLCKDSLWLTKKNTFVEISKCEEVFNLKRKENSYLSRIYSNKYLLLREEEEFYIINKEGKEFIRLTDSFIFYDDNIILIDKYESKKAILYDFINKKELFSFSESIGTVIYSDQDSICLGHTANSFRCFNLKNGFIKWEYNAKILFNESDKFNKYEFGITNVVGVIENKLWIVLRKGNVIALDIETGEIIYNLLHPSNRFSFFYEKYGERNHFNSKFQIVSSKHLMCLNAFYFFEVIEDKQNRKAKIESIDLTEEFDRNELGYASAPVSYPTIGNYIVTVHSGSSEKPYNIGIFDMKTKKIVDRFSLSVGNNTKYKTLIYEHPNITDLKIMDGKAYALYGPLGSKRLAVIDLELEKLQKSEII